MHLDMIMNKIESQILNFLKLMDFPNLRKKMLKPVSRRKDHVLYGTTNRVQVTGVGQRLIDDNLAGDSSSKTSKNNGGDSNLLQDLIKAERGLLYTPMKNEQLMNQIKVKRRESRFSQNGISLNKKVTQGPETHNQNMREEHLTLFEELEKIFHMISLIQSEGEKDEILKEKIEFFLGFEEGRVISNALNKLMQKQLLKDEAKVFICSESLVICLIIIKTYNMFLKNQYFAKINPFQLLNPINRNILEYQKSKYPRNKNLFVPAELESRFDRINFLTLHENNMLVNSGFSFTDRNASRTQILDKTKKFINCLMEEVNEKYPSFVEILSNKVLKLENDLDIKLNKIKIGRKIPENTEKFYDFGTDNMQITSPQLFRVMIKWIQQMENLLNNPSNLISKRTSMKYIKKMQKGKGKVIFDQIQSRRFEEMKIQIIEKITFEKDYSQAIKQLLGKLNTFNDNLVKTLTARSPKIKFIQEEHAEALKFSKFNTLFLEWLIVEKFLVIINTLSKLSHQFQNKFYKKLDFINFHVFDLMRASFSGKKNQILEVFNNLKMLEGKNQLSLIRIKNRLNTPLNDVLINFKLNDSFIVCELQLILVEFNQDGEEKLKILEDLNHTIYELERSPYGPMSEMAMIIGYNDPTIFYEKKINFKKDWFTDEICQKTSGRHQFIEFKEQTTPFVCSWCVNFYGRLANFFEYHQCIHCSLQKCKACVFEADPTEEKRVYYKYFASCFLSIDLEEIENDKDDDFIDNFFITEDYNFISEKYIKVRDHIKLDSHTKIEEIEKLLHQKQMDYGMKATQPFYCLLLRFYHGISQLKMLKYVNYKLDYFQDEENQIHQNTKLQKHDAIFLFRKRVYLNQKNQNTNTFIEKIKNIQGKALKSLINGHKVHTKRFKQGYEAVTIFHNKLRYLLEFRKIAHGNQPRDQEKIKRVMERTVTRCENYKAERICFQLQSLNISESHLTDISHRNWVQDIKVLNLAENRIKELRDILPKFSNLKEIYLLKNLINDFDSLGFKDKFANNLRVLDISYNSLTKIQDEINLFTQLSVFKVSCNSIQSHPILKLQNLEQLYINGNLINNLQCLLSSKLPLLQILDISQNKLAGSYNLQWKKMKVFENLRKLEAKNIKMEIMENEEPFILSILPKLEYLDITENKICRLGVFAEKRLRELKMVFCSIVNIEGIFTEKMIHLEELDLQANQIQVFPQLELPELKILKLGRNKINNVSNICKSYLPNLLVLEIPSNAADEIDALEDADLPKITQILLQYNNIKSLPILSFQNLVQLNLTNNHLQNIDNLSKSSLPKISKLLLRHNKIQSLPKISFPSLSEISPMFNKINDISEFAKSNLGNVNKIQLFNNKLEKVPEFFQDNIYSLNLFENQIENIEGLTTSRLSSIKVISLFKNCIKVLPVIRFQILEKFYAYRNQIQDIQCLEKWETPQLRILDLNNNKIQHIPKLSFVSLNELELSYNEIESITEFSRSTLSQLRKLYINGNKKIKETANLSNFPKLEQLHMNQCGLQEFGIFAQSQLKNLRRITLEGNKIEKLPVLKFKNLEELLLRKNNISNISCGFKSLKKLKKLFLSENQIQVIEAEYFQGCHLNQLSFSRNPLQKIELPEEMRLKSLTLNNCSLKSLKGLYLPKLQDLFANNNELQDLKFLQQPGGFLNLKKIFIKNNKITQIPTLDLPDLEQIFLFNNPILEIHEILNSLLPNIKRVFLRKVSSSSTKKKKYVSETARKEMENLSLKMVHSKEVIESSSDDDDDSNGNDDGNGMEEKKEKEKKEQIAISGLEKKNSQVQSKIEETERQTFIKDFHNMFPNSRIIF